MSQIIKITIRSELKKDIAVARLMMCGGQDNNAVINKVHQILTALLIGVGGHGYIIMSRLRGADE